MEADQNRTDADDIAVALFDVDQSAPIGLAIDDDEYWEPEAYRSASGGCTQNSALPSSWPAFSSCRDENTPPLNGENDIIDLCSSQGSVEASSSCSAAVLFSAKRSSGPAAAVDLTQDCDDEPSEYYEESTQRDSVHIRETSLPGQTVPAVSLSKRVAAAPTLQSIVDTRPAAAEPSVRGSNSMAGEEIITRCSSILSVSAVSRRTQEDSGGEVVSEQHTLERSTRISITTKKTGGKTATTTKADGTTGSSRVRVSKAKALPSTTEEPVAVAPQAYTGSSNAAAPLPAIQSAFRSRFTEKTLLPLPTLTGGATWEVMLLIDQREKSNAQIQTQMAARCIPCRLATLAVGDFLWVVRPRGGTGVVGACSSSGAPVAVSAPVASQRSWTVTEEEEEDGDTRASAANGRVAGAEEEDDDEDRSFDTSNVFVLDCVAERKSINDLVSSLTDGRYIEQKNRLMACKLRSTMYIVEGDPTHVTARQKAITPLHIKNAMIALHVSGHCLCDLFISCDRYHVLYVCRWTTTSTCCGRGAWTTRSPLCRTSTGESVHSTVVLLAVQVVAKLNSPGCTCVQASGESISTRAQRRDQPLPGVPGVPVGLRQEECLHTGAAVRAPAAANPGLLHLGGGDADGPLRHHRAVHV